MEAARNYACRVRLDGDVAFVVWYSGERDGFRYDADGRLLVARTQELLAVSSQVLGVALEDAEPAEYDFDHIRAWCAAPDPAGMDCPAFLNAWNFFDDLAGLHTGADTPYTRLSREAVGCYERLFWGSNLPTVTPPGERFEPVWATDELAAIRRILETGLDLFIAKLW